MKNLDYLPNKVVLFLFFYYNMEYRFYDSVTLKLNKTTRKHKRKHLYIYFIYNDLSIDTYKGKKKYYNGYFKTKTYTIYQFTTLIIQYIGTYLYPALLVEYSN